jgi:nucleoside-diphosphate-sugar epimerase
MPFRILVTGSSGFIGAAVCSALAAAGHSVRAASRKPNRTANDANIEWVELPDLGEAVDWSPLVAGIDVVVHLAAIAHRNASEDGDYLRVNHAATASLAACCCRHAVKRLIFMSSIGVQTGSAADHVVTEIDKPRPVTGYDRAKLAAEEDIRRSGAPFTILRPVVVYGAGAKANIALVMRIAALPLPLPFGAFRNRRSMVAIENLAQAIMLCLDSPQTLNQAFLVSDPEPIALGDMFAALREGAGRSPMLVPIPPAAIRVLLKIARRSELWDRIGRELIASSTKLQKAGWSPHIETKAGLRAMARTAQRRGARIPFRCLPFMPRQ